MASTTALNPDFQVKQIVLKPEPITPEQERLWIDTRTAVLWVAPAFTYLLYNMMNPHESKLVAYFTKEVPIAATDGLCLFLNPETFFKYTLQERVFIVAHEIMHCVYNHNGLMHVWNTAKKVSYADGTSLPYDQELANVAADLIINDLLVDSQIGTFNKDWLHDKTLADCSMSFADAYKKIFKQKQGGGGGGKGGGAGGGNLSGKGFDQHLKPGAGFGQNPTVAQQGRDQGAWDAAINAAKAQGKLPAAMERAFTVATEPQVDWREVIHAFFARKVGNGSEDWRRPDRRFIGADMYLPSRSGHGAGTIAVAIDTSGSIGQPELDVFFAELQGILVELRPRQTLVMWCDAQVHKVDEIEQPEDIGGLKPVGGGGTSFVPVFEWLAENDVVPDALVYLTDMYGTFPDKAPRYPVLWGRTTKQEAPWGDVVDVPLNARDH